MQRANGAATSIENPDAAVELVRRLVAWTDFTSDEFEQRRPLAALETWRSNRLFSDGARKLVRSEHRSGLSLEAT